VKKINNKEYWMKKTTELEEDWSNGDYHCIVKVLPIEKHRKHLNQECSGLIHIMMY